MRQEDRTDHARHTPDKLTCYLHSQLDTLTEFATGRRVLRYATAFFLLVVAMVHHGAQIQRCGRAKHNLCSAQSLPHNLARLYSRVLPFTSTDLGGGAAPHINARWAWADSHGQKSFPVTRTRCRVPRQLHNQLLNAERTCNVPDHCPDRTDVVRLDRRNVSLVQ